MLLPERPSDIVRTGSWSQDAVGPVIRYELSPCGQNAKISLVSSDHFVTAKIRMP